MVTHILLVEDVGPDSAESLSPYLRQCDHQHLTISSYETAVTQQMTGWPDLMVLNCWNGLPPDPGRIVEKNHLKIPMIVVGNKEGVNGKFPPDTIMVAAHQPQQLTQAVQMVVSAQPPRFIRLPGLILDCRMRQILCDGQTHSLTPKEFKLLHLLASQPNQTIGRKAIMETVWETSYLGDTRTLDVHIRWLREKIEVEPGHPQRLVTVRRVGYTLLSPLSPNGSQPHG